MHSSKTRKEPSSTLQAYKQLETLFDSTVQIFQDRKGSQMESEDSKA